MAESPQPLSPLVPTPTPPEHLANGYPHLTPTEQRIIDLLKDGKPHWRAELKALLNDDMAGPNAVAMHLRNVRRKIVKHRKMIVCVHPAPEDYSRVGYQLVRF